MTLGYRTLLELAALGAIALCSCAETTQNHQDKNTNWLMACEATGECGDGLECVCGLCTRVCEETAQCGALGELAVCGALSVGESACAASERALSVCTLGCESDGTCLARNEGLVCLDDHCTPEPPPMNGDTGSMTDGGPRMDAGLTPDAGQPPDATVTRDGTVDPVPDATMQDELAAACGSGFVCTNVVAAPGQAESFVIDGDGYLYWADWGTRDALQNYNGDGAIKRVPKTGGSAETLRAVDRPWRLWLDAERFYWQGGEPGDYGTGPGQQGLYAAPRQLSGDEDAGAAFDATVTLHEGTEPGDLANTQVRPPYVAWQRPMMSGGMSGVLVTLENLDLPAQPPTLLSIAGPFNLFAVDPQGRLYLDDGGGSIVRYGSVTEELLEDPPGFLPTLHGNTIWLIRTTDDNQDWVAAMPAAGGPLTNVGSADGYFDAPQPGATVVWLITGVQNTATWQLWTIPIEGGERTLAFSFPTERSVVREDAPPPLWIADGDQAWVFGYGSIVRVSR